MGRPRKYDKPQKEPGANTAALKHALAGFKQPRVDTRDPQAIAQRIESYLTYCMNNDVSPTVSGCTNWLGISNDTLSKWYSGASGSPEHQRVAARFYGILQDIWQTDMHEGNVNPVSGIFVGKAFYGYKDTQEIVIQQKESQELSVADLIAESKRLPGAETLAIADSSTSIDADYKVVEDDPRYNRAKERADRIAERKAHPKRPHMQKYYQEHKEEMKEKIYAARARRKAAEKAQKEAQKEAQKDG